MFVVYCGKGRNENLPWYRYDGGLKTGAQALVMQQTFKSKFGLLNH